MQSRAGFGRFCCHVAPSPIAPAPARGIPPPTLVASKQHIRAMAGKASPAKQIQKVQTKNLQLITEYCQDDLETQMLVLSYIEDLREQKSGKNRLKKSGGAPDTGMKAVEDDEPASCGPGFAIPDSHEVSDKQVKFANWKKQLIVELFSSVEPRVFSIAVVKVDSLQLARQLLTYGWDVECIDSPKSDKCSTRKKKDLFERLRQLYMGLGSRLRSIELHDGFVDWSRHGHYSLEDIQTPAGREVRIQDKVAGKFACIPSEIVGGHSGVWSAKDNMCNFSYNDAKIKVPSGGEFVLASLFPKVRRNRSRRMSEELAAVSHGGKQTRPASHGTVGVSPSSAQLALVDSIAKSEPAAAGSTVRKRTFSKTKDPKAASNTQGQPARKKKRETKPASARLAQQDGPPPSPTAADVDAAAGLGIAGGGEVQPAAGEIPQTSPDGECQDEHGESEGAECAESEEKSPDLAA